MVNLQPTSDEFRGFDKARSILWCHEARARVYLGLSQTSFLLDGSVASVHVDNTTRGDRCFLTAFDVRGEQVGGETVFVDDPSQRLEVTPEFDHDFTSMRVPEGSDLAAAVAREDGWAVDLGALRQYDPVGDRRETQRAVFLAHMGDMVAGGQIRGFSRPSSSDEEPGEGRGSSAA